jgi:hypothetical protein
MRTKRQRAERERRGYLAQLEEDVVVGQMFAAKERRRLEGREERSM